MSKQIRLTLSDELLQRAEVFAGHSGRQVADVPTEAIEASLDTIVLPRADVHPPVEWSDAQVLAAADAIMPPEPDRRLSELLDQQQAQSLTD